MKKKHSIRSVNQNSPYVYPLCDLTSQVYSRLLQFVCFAKILLLLEFWNKKPADFA